MDTTPIPVVQPIEIQLAIMNTKLDLLLAGKDDHETRIRKLEQFAWKQAGAVGLVAALVGGGIMKFLS